MAVKATYRSSDLSGWTATYTMKGNAPPGNKLYNKSLANTYKKDREARRGGGLQGELADGQSQDFQEHGRVDHEERPGRR